VLLDSIIGAAIEVHRELGPGLFESVYEQCLALELGLRGLRVERQKTLSVTYKGVSIEHAYRPDLIVDGAVLVELKSVETLQRLHESQLLSYLRLSGYETGLLINFNVPILKQGIRRLTREWRRRQSFSRAPESPALP
jgi:GxxExxY protein